MKSIFNHLFHTVAVLLAVALLSWSVPVQAQYTLGGLGGGNYLPEGYTTPEPGTVVDCGMLEAVRDKLFLVGCTPLYTGVIMQDSEITVGYLVCTWFDETHCPSVVLMMFEGDQEPFDAAAPLVCTVNGRWSGVEDDNLTFRCEQ
jgi:hypothetical protein